MSLDTRYLPILRELLTLCEFAAPDVQTEAMLRSAVDDCGHSVWRTAWKHLRDSPCIEALSSGTVRWRRGEKLPDFESEQIPRRDSRPWSKSASMEPADLTVDEFVAEALVRLSSGEEIRAHTLRLDLRCPTDLWVLVGRRMRAEPSVVHKGRGLLSCYALRKDARA